MNILGKCLRSIMRLFNVAGSMFRLYSYSFAYQGFSFEKGVYIERGVRIKVTDNGRIKLCENVSIERNSTLVAKYGTILIGSNTFIGEGSIIVANSSVSIGPDCLIAAGVTIRDQDHRLEDVTIPVRQQGTFTASIYIGSDVWVGAKATILKGVKLGDQSVVGANSVVTKDVLTRDIVGGVPSKVLKSRQEG